MFRASNFEFEPKRFPSSRKTGDGFYSIPVDGHEGHQGLGGQDFVVGSLVEYLGFSYQDTASFPDYPGFTGQTVTVGGLQEIDFKLNGQDAMRFIHQAEGGIPGRVVGHGGQDSCMNVLILLAMAVQHLQPGFQVPASVFPDLVAHIPDKTPGIVQG
jgi:hypothetical protein